MKHDIDVYENIMFYCACVIILSFVVIGILLFTKEEYTASSIFVSVAFLYVKDIIFTALEVNRKERKALERDIDRRFRYLLQDRYVTITCKDCIFRFSCKQAYKKEETYGRCSLNMYKK